MGKNYLFLRKKVTQAAFWKAKKIDQKITEKKPTIINPPYKGMFCPLNPQFFNIKDKTEKG